MISRIWHGWTILENADAYEALLKSEILPGIQHGKFAGFCGIDLLRRPVEDEIEFITILWFDSLEGVRQFAGPDYARAVVPPDARKLLKRFDEESQHYEVRLALEV